LRITQWQQDRRVSKLASSDLLMSAASGLERLMIDNKNNKNIQDSNVAQISAFLYYQASVLSKLEGNKAFQSKFKTIIFNQIEKDFGAYMDSQARVKPKSFHHVYEWRLVGSPEGRLFKLKPLSSQGLSLRIDSEFLMSKTLVPYTKRKGTKRYKFANKAEIMESGTPVIIRPRASKRLVFEIDGLTVFMPKGASVTVKSPGGAASNHQYRIAYSRFFTGQLVNQSIKRSGFQNIFNGKIGKALSVPGNIKRVQYSFSPNAIRNQAESSLTMAFGGAL
jgi:hypothetical protein